MKTKKEFYAAQAQVLKALAHPTRLLLLNRLSAKPVCVCELTEAAGCDISTVSLHLNLLRRAGIVQSEKKGNWVFYSLKCRCLLQFLDCITSVVKDSAAAQAKSAAGGAR